MSFLNTAAFALAFLLPLVILLYFLKLKRKDQIISSIFLWQKAVSDLQANTPFQKLRRNLLLLLQLLILTSIIFALARPYIQAKLTRGKYMVVILDSSASMKSTDVGTSRFDEAKKAAIGLVDGLLPGDNMLVISSSSKNQVVTGFMGDKNHLKRVIHSLQPTDTIANIKDAILLAESLLSEKKGGHIVFISDGALSSTGEIKVQSNNIHFIKIGNSNNNIAITSLDIRPVTNNPDLFQAFVSLRNYKSEPVTGTISFYVNDDLVDAREINIAATGKLSHIFDRINVKDGIVSVKIDIHDDLAVDNIASSSLLIHQRMSVLLVSKGNYFLEQALSLYPGLNISKIDPNNYAKQPGFDVVIFDNTSPVNLSPGNYLFINAIPGDIPVKELGMVEEPEIIDWDRAHDITRYVNFGTIQISSARKLQLPSSARILLESRETPLLFTYEDKGKRMMFMGFDLYDSNLPLRIGFPVFIANTLDWLKKQSKSTEYGMVPTGTVLPIYHGGDIKEINVTDPAGRITRLDTHQNPVYFNGINSVGVYQIQLGDSKQYFTANLLNENESNIQPLDNIQIGSQNIQNQPKILISNMEISIWFILLALMIILGEWWVYHRRITV